MCGGAGARVQCNARRQPWLCGQSLKADQCSRPGFTISGDSVNLKMTTQFTANRILFGKRDFVIKGMNVKKLPKTLASIFDTRDGF